MITRPSTTDSPVSQSAGNDCLSAMPETLDLFLRHATDIARQHRMPTPAIMIHALAAAAALAHGFISSDKAGTPRLPLLVRCDESSLPDWMAEEWQVLEGISDVCNRPSILDHPQRRAAMRRRERIRKLLDPDQMLAPSMMDILKSRRLYFGRVAVTHGKRKLASPGAMRFLTHLCASLPQVRAVLRRTCQGQQRESLIGCVDSREFNQLVKDQGPLLVERTGLVLPVRRLNPALHPRITNQTMTSLLHETFIHRHQGEPRYVFSPESRTRKALEDHVNARRSLDSELPEVIRPFLPDPMRVWHMAALLAGMCDRKDQAAGMHAAAMAMSLDRWATKHHLHQIRLSYPADHRGWFEGTDLAVFRQLGESPQTVRDIQRRLRGVRKEDCLGPLQRAVEASLAVESPGPRYQLPRPPVSELSEKAYQKLCSSDL